MLVVCALCALRAQSLGQRVWRARRPRSCGLTTSDSAVALAIRLFGASNAMGMSLVHARSACGAGALTVPGGQPRNFNARQVRCTVPASGQRPPSSSGGVGGGACHIDGMLSACCFPFGSANVGGGDGLFVGVARCVGRVGIVSVVGLVCVAVGVDDGCPFRQCALRPLLLWMPPSSPALMCPP